MTRILRPHQQQAYDAVRADWAAGIVRTTVVHPTGLGKGDLVAKIATDEAAAGGRALVLCHRAEVLDQLTERCRAYDPSIPIGRVQASTNQSRRPITMAMIQTLAREKRRGRLSPPTLVIVDECHRVASDSYQAVLRWAGSFERTRTLGLTATLVRGDRRGLGDTWEKVSDKREISWAVENGWLVRPRGKVVVVDHLDLNQVKTSRGDYQDDALGEAVERDVDQIVKEWHQHAADRVTIAFTPTVASAHALCNEFVNSGVAAEVVTGATSTADRKAMFARLHDGITQVLINVYVLVEGWDESRVNCVLMARPTKLPGVYVQAVGRGLRPSPGKVDCLVLDVCGMSRRQKLVTLTDLSLSVEYDRSALDELPCEDCGLYPCECPPEETGVGPGRRRLIGPAVYEDLDLLLETSSYSWLQTHAGTPFLPGGGDRMAVLWLDPDSDLYIVGHCAMKGLAVDGHRLGEGLTLDEARRVAEEWATVHGLAAGLNTHSRKAGWRKTGNATPEQLKWARELRIPDAESMSKAQLSDAISVGRASRMIDRRTA